VLLLFNVSFPSERKKVYEITWLSARACPFRSLNQWTDFHEIWYQCCAIRSHPSPVISNFLQSLVQHGGRANRWGVRNIGDTQTEMICNNGLQTLVFTALKNKVVVRGFDTVWWCSRIPKFWRTMPPPSLEWNTYIMFPFMIISQ
jgi:hypothetical protein